MVYRPILAVAFLGVLLAGCAQFGPTRAEENQTEGRVVATDRSAGTVTVLGIDGGSYVFDDGSSADLQRSRVTAGDRVNVIWVDRDGQKILTGITPIG